MHTPPCFLECQPFSMVLDALKDGVTVYDREGTLIWINDKACRILGTPRAELLGRDVSEIATLPTVQALVTTEFIGRSLADIRQHHTRLEDYAAQGYMTFTNGRQMLYSGSQVRDEHGNLVYGIYTIRDVTDLQEARKQVEELRKLTTLYQTQLHTLHTQVLGHDIVYRSESMRQVVERILRLARFDGNVLLTGETGVGKGLLAHYLHVLSRRSSGPFIHVNCASLPESLIEAELFGYTEGAFTDASRKGRKGMIELGQGGTVFLDEIGDMPLSMQAKLLTVLEDKEIRRIGGEKWIAVDVHFVAATNKDPETLLSNKVLREDLYYRLATNQVHIPPVRERPEDISCLIDHVLGEFNEKNGTDLSLHAEVVRHLQMLSWPGNVRELKNVVWQIISESGEESGEITWPKLPADLRRTLTRQRETPGAGSHTHPAPAERDAAEEQQLRELCAQWQGDVYAMADALGVHRTTILRKLKRYGLSSASKRTSCATRPESSFASPPLGAPSNDNGRHS